MCRSQLDTVRARLADAAYLPRAELGDIAGRLLAELERTRMREALIRTEHAQLVAAAQATLAARGRRPSPLPPWLVLLEHELTTRGHRIPAAHESPGRILADAAALRPLLDGDTAREARR